MRLLKTIALSFSMFSTIPMPKVEWSEENMRYMLCSFSLVGVVIGASWLLLDFCFSYFGLEKSALRAALLVLLPVLLSGGIHMDGFCDTADALSSHADREKKLAILKDSHCGAFAVIYAIMYFLVYFACLLDMGKIEFPLCAVFVLERLLSALSVATFPLAKSSGLVHTFATASAKKRVAFVTAFLFVLLSSLLIAFFALKGFVVVLTCLLTFLLYYIFAKKEFGGITGDISGSFVQSCELATIVVFGITKSLL